MFACRRDSLARIVVCLFAASAASTLPACKSPGGAPTGDTTIVRAALSSGGGVTSTNLQLRVSKNACAANVAQDYFKVTNASAGAVPLSSIAIKYWVNDTTAASLIANVWYGGCVTSPNGTCLHPVSGVIATPTRFTPACGPDATHQANWEVTISTSDATPLAPGQTWSNLQTAINLSTYANFAPGTPTWFSACGSGGAFLLDSHFAVYDAGNLVTAEGAAAPLCRAPETIQIQNYLDTTYYATSDIASSFLSSAGQQIDCIDFSAQKSVKAWRARGVTHLAELPRAAAAPGIDAAAQHLAGLHPQQRRPRPEWAPAPVRDRVRAGHSSYRCDGPDSRRHRGVQAGPGAKAAAPGAYLPADPVPSQRLPGRLHARLLAQQHRTGGRRLTKGRLGAYRRIQTSGFMPAGAAGYYGLHITTPVYEPVIHSTGDHEDSQLWAQTGGCDNWYNPIDPATGAVVPPNQCRTDKNCTNCSDGDCDRCAVQSMEVVSIASVPGAPQTDIFFTNDGYFQSVCWADGGGGPGCPGCPPNPDTGEPTNCSVPLPNSPIIPGMTESLAPAQKPNQYGVIPAEVDFTVFNGSGVAMPGWYVYFGTSQQPVGYYPAESFNWPDGSTGAMSQGPATYLQAGGEVFNAWPGGQHTETSMVSDNNAWSGYEFAAYERNVYYYDANKNPYDANLTFITTPQAEGDFQVPGLCGLHSGSWLDAAGESGEYSIASGNGVPAGAPGWGTYFYFGGGVTAKEVSARCPNGGCLDLHFQSFNLQGFGNSTPIGQSVGRACGLSEVSGKFKGGGEAARIAIDANENWSLSVTSGQDQQTSAQAVCFDELSTGPEFSWTQGQPTVVIGPSGGMACFLTGITGHFQGSGEVVQVSVDPSDNMWKLGGTSGETGVSATARCVPASGIEIFGQGQNNPPRDLGPGPGPGTTSGRICAISRMTGHFEGGGENIFLTPGPAGGDWTFTIVSGQNDVAGSATCFTP